MFQKEIRYVKVMSVSLNYLEGFGQGNCGIVNVKQHIALYFFSEK